jgi:uncharacterized membrane protein
MKDFAKPNWQLAGKLAIAAIFSAVMLACYSNSFRGDKGLDFRAFYSSAQIIRNGDGLRLYDLATQKAYQLQSAGGLGLTFYYPPATSLLYLPVAYVPLETAFVLWTAISMSLLAGCVFLLNRFLHVFRDAFWAYLLSFLFLPVHILFLQGQVDAVVLLAYVLAFIAMQSKRDFLSGFALSLGLVKFHLVLPFVGVLLIRRQWRWLLGFSAGSALFIGVCTFLAGPVFLCSYSAVLLHLKDFAQAGYRPATMGNLHGILFVLFRAEPSLWVVALTSAVVFLSAAFLWQKNTTGFAAALVITLLTSYHLNPHDLVLLIVPLAITIKKFNWRSFEGLVGLSIALPLLPALFLWKHTFALMAIPLMMYAYCLLKKLRVRIDQRPNPSPA